MSEEFFSVDTRKFDLLLFGVLDQACRVEGGLIDNMCISVYEEACDYLVSRGYLRTKDGRIYEVVDEFI